MTSGMRPEALISSRREAVTSAGADGRRRRAL